MAIQHYRDLIVWQKAIDLVVDVYKLTEKFPRHEQYGLTSQMRRSAVSIPSNIAEGYYRQTRRDYARFISIAFGSGSELETQIFISKRLGYCLESDFVILDDRLLQIMKMLNVLRRQLS